ncbi:MAG: hypothetical protein NTU59_11235, partial [Coprothermobacterota bacterium]|nr:hypothetical protein [Coprothermobacterota bacterium]
MKRWSSLFLAFSLCLFFASPAMGLVPPPLLPTSVPILDIAGLGKVEADLANQKLVFTCYDPGNVPLEYSILASGSYSQSEAGGWGSSEVTPAVKKEVLPHY